MISPERGFALGLLGKNVFVFFTNKKKIIMSKNKLFNSI